MALIEQFRTATHDMHEGLHTHPLLAPLTEKTISREDYGWVLRAFYNAYASFESRREGGPSLDLPDAPALAWLKHDMDRQGIEPFPSPLPPYPVIDTPSKLMGYLYVKQGSTLGGQLITKHLAETLGLVAGIDNVFFAGYGKDNGVRWKEFLAALNTRTTDIDEALAQAVATFKIILESCDAMQRLRRQAAA